MEKLNVKVCVKPYFHDVIDEVARKPKYDKRLDKHFITYKSNAHELVKTKDGYIIWVEEE